MWLLVLSLELGYPALNPGGCQKDPSCSSFWSLLFSFCLCWNLVLLSAPSVGGVVPRPFLYSWLRGLLAGEEVWETGDNSPGQPATHRLLLKAVWGTVLESPGTNKSRYHVLVFVL